MTWILPSRLLSACAVASYLSRLRSLCEIFCADWECSEVAA